MGLQGIGAFILVVGGLVAVHEFGHFVVAKLLGVKVLRFSIGFGPRLLWWTVGETEYRISALPLGGYVKMAGDVPGEETPPEDRGRGFFDQQPWKRIVIGFAGPAANFLFPVLLFTAVAIAANGDPTPAAAVGAIVPGSAAERAGLRPDDRIVSVASPGTSGRPLRWWEDLVDAVAPHPGERLSFVVDRGGQRQVLEVVPEEEDRFNGVETDRVGVIGITPNWPSPVVVPAAPGAAGPLAPFDEITQVAGRPVAHYGEIARAFAAAGCRPVDVEVRRGAGAERKALPLAAVPTCAGEGLSVLPVQKELSAVVGRVEDGGPAALAGLVPGDVIVAANGARVRSFRDLDGLEGALKPGQPIVLGLSGGRTVSLVPRAETIKDRETGERVQRLELGFGAVPRDLAMRGAVPVATVAASRGLAEITGVALDQTWRMTRLTAVGIFKILTGQISHRQVGGIIMLFDQSAEAAAAGIGSLLFLMALVSVNLGLMNLLPIPVLDGGHVVASLVEQVTRRPLSMRVREVATYVGLVLLGLLMILAFHNDILRMLG
jgi:regulator of sigma E protease